MGVKYQKPSWFDIKKYEPTFHLTAREWAYQLTLRRDITRDIDEAILADSEGQFREGMRKLEVLTNEPVQKTPDSFNMPPVTEHFEKHDIPGLNFISPVSRRNAMQAPLRMPVIRSKEELRNRGGTELLTELGNYIAGHADGLRLENNFLGQEMPEVLKSSGIFDAQYTDLSLNRGIVFLTADLNASDEVLFDEFRIYLNHVREHYGYSDGTLKKESIAKRLAKLGVLPFLDLELGYDLLIEIGQKSKAAPYTNHILGDWIFPNTDFETDVTERVRKTTRPLAKRALTHHFINVLANL